MILQIAKVALIEEAATGGDSSITHMSLSAVTAFNLWRLCNLP